MDFKKRKDFTPKKEDNTFSKRRKSKLINKELFPGKFVCFFVSLFKRMKDSALVKFYNTAVRLLEHLQGKSVMETIIINNIKISSCLANGQVEIHLELSN